MESYTIKALAVGGSIFVLISLMVAALWTSHRGTDGSPYQDVVTSVPVNPYVAPLRPYFPPTLPVVRPSLPAGA